MLTASGQDKIMENVVRISYDDDGRLVLADLFGDEQRVDARIREIALLEHKIFLESTVPDQVPEGQTSA
jgi:predicted RNA-binding protein